MPGKSFDRTTLHVFEVVTGSQIQLAQLLPFTQHACNPDFCVGAAAAHSIGWCTAPAAGQACYVWCCCCFCSAVCKPGTYVDANGDCNSCPQGWVSTAAAAASTCSRCPIPLVAAEEQASCICPGSMKLSCETNKCYCPMGSCKAAEEGFVCKACPSGTTTTRIDALSCVGEASQLCISLNPHAVWWCSYRSRPTIPELVLRL
jgi:hypothetical protein